MEGRDSFLRWWFFFLFKNLSAVELLGPEEAFSRIVAPKLDRFFSNCFEDFCRQWLHRHYIVGEGALGDVVVGQYWRHEFARGSGSLPRANLQPAFVLCWQSLTQAVSTASPTW